MVDQPFFTSAWPRVMNVLGVGCYFFSWVFLLGITTSVFRTTNSLKLDLPNSTITFGFIFVSYVIGEIFCGIGRGVQTRKQPNLALIAMVKFCQNDKTGFWLNKLELADMKAELFRGISAVTVFAAPCSMLVLLLNDRPLKLLVLLALFSVAAFWVSKTISHNAYDQIASAMDEYLEAIS